MPVALRLRSITSSLSIRLLLIVVLTVALLFAAYTVLSSQFQRALLNEHLEADATRVSELIKHSLLTSMLHNERERIHATVAQLANEPSIEVVQIYNKRGEIVFSSNPMEVGRLVDLQAEACYMCHATDRPLESASTEVRVRTYLAPSGHRVVGFINPIRNEARCTGAPCHAHPPEQAILGVLDVQVSAEGVETSIARMQRAAMLLAGGIVSLAALVLAAILYRTVYLPIRSLREGTEALAAGDLDVEVRQDRRDELGALARSFNAMARSLKRADTELRSWSATLEDRVQEKTAELEQMNRQMIQVEKAASLGRMAATVAHELNNPLSGILTYAKLMSRKLTALLPAGDERQRLLDHLDLIRSESTRCGNIVRDLLTYAREGPAALVPAPLHAVVDRALRLVAHHVELRNVAVQREFTLEDDVLVCDAERIQQALIALMINAIEAMPGGGRLTVRTAVDPDDAARVLLCVRDTGIGIPEDAREHVFDPFYSTKNEAKGVGLGLAVVYGIVQRHRGDIRVTSKPGKGTTFTLVLPRDPERVRGGEPKTTVQTEPA